MLYYLLAKPLIDSANWGGTENTLCGRPPSCQKGSKEHLPASFHQGPRASHTPPWESWSGGGVQGQNGPAQRAPSPACLHSPLCAHTPVMTWQVGLPNQPQPAGAGPSLAKSVHPHTPHLFAPSVLCPWTVPPLISPADKIQSTLPPL